MFDKKKYVETYSELHASKDTLKKVFEKAAHKQKRIKHFPRSAIVLAALLVLIVSSVTFASNGIVHRSTWVHSGTIKEIEQMGFYYPKQLGKYQVNEHQISRNHLAPTESDDTLAFFKPDYTSMTLRYDNGPYQSLSLSFGKMDNPLWAYHFGYNEETGIWDGAADPSSYTISDTYGGTVSYIDNLDKHKYKGCTIYLYNWVTEYNNSVNDDIPIDKYQDAAAKWTDPEAGICFSVTAEYTISEKKELTSGEEVYTYVRDEQGVTKEEMLEYVKKIIDSCHTEK